VRFNEVDIAVDGDGRDGALRKVIAESSVQPGARLEHAQYDALKTSLLRTAQERGYLDAKITRRELVVDPAKRLADARITLETGGLYRFGHITSSSMRSSPSCCRASCASRRAIRSSPSSFATPSLRSRTAATSRWSAQARAIATPRP
jgi:hypothetical protein